MSAVRVFAGSPCQWAVVSKNVVGLFGFEEIAGEFSFPVGAAAYRDDV